MFTLNEVDQVVQQWSQTGLTEGFDDKTSISLCLQAQLKLNEHLKLHPQFLRISLPLLVRSFKESKAFDRNYFTNYGDKPDEPSVYFFKAKFMPSNEASSLEQETENCIKLATCIKEEIDELFKDCRNKTFTFHGISHTPDGELLLHYN